MIKKLISPTPARIRLAAEKAAHEAVDFYVSKRGRLTYADVLASLLKNADLEQELFLASCLIQLFESLRLDPAGQVALARKANYVACLLQADPRNPYLIKRISETLALLCSPGEHQRFIMEHRNASKPKFSTAGVNYR